MSQILSLMMKPEHFLKLYINSQETMKEGL